MWQLYVYSFLAGLVGASGVPHFVKGVTGQKYQTPFGKGSSATVNVVFGWVLFVAAGLLIYFAHPRANHHELRSFGLLALGVLVTGVVMAMAWSKHPQSSK